MLSNTDGYAQPNDQVPISQGKNREEEKKSKKNGANPKGVKKPLKMTLSSLSQIIQESLTNHPSIRADKEAVSASEDGIDQASAGYLPTIDMRMSLGRENIRRVFLPNPLNPLPSQGSVSSTRTDPSVTIRQLLFDGMGVSARVDRARSQRQQALGTLGVTTDTTMLEAASAAIDLRRLQRLMRIVEYNIKFHEIMRNRVAEVVEAGALPISDLYQIEARLQDTFVSKANIQAELEVARAKFMEAVGKEPPDHIQRISLPASLIPASPEIAVRMAYDHNNIIKVAKSNVQIAETNRRETASKFVPTLTFELEGERDRNLGGIAGTQGRLTALLIAKHNIFNGGADMAKSRETVKRLTEAHARLGMVHRQTERTIRTAWAETKSSQAKSNHLTRLIHEKRQIRNSYLTEFTLGKRTLIDILDSANDVFITEATRTTADATMDINMVTISIGIGKFKEFIQRSKNLPAVPEDELETPSAFDELDMHPVSYQKASSEIQSKKNLTKPTVPKRKSIFEQRKDQRQNELEGKGEA